MTDHCRRCEERLLTVRDVEAEIRTAISKLDILWPETERYGCRKVHIVELLDTLKLSLYKRADKNATSHISAFEKAARKLMGQDPERGRDPMDHGQMAPQSTTRDQNAALKDRIRRNT